MKRYKPLVGNSTGHSLYAWVFPVRRALIWNDAVQCHVTWCRYVTRCCVILWCFVRSCADVVLHDVVLYAVSCHVGEVRMSCDVLSCHITGCCVLSYVFPCHIQDLDVGWHFVMSYYMSCLMKCHVQDEDVLWWDVYARWFNFMGHVSLRSFQSWLWGLCNVMVI